MKQKKINALFIANLKIIKQQQQHFIPFLKEQYYKHWQTAVSIANRGGLSRIKTKIKTLFTWNGGPRSSGISYFCFVSPRAWKQKKLTPLDRGPPLHVNRP